MEPNQKQYPAVDVTGDRSKVRCCKEQYCVGTWNVRTMNQGKLKVVKQEMARVNVDILGISELKWTGMGLTTGPPGKSDNINNKIHIEPLKQLTSVTAPNSPSDPPMKEAIFISISEMSKPRLREGK